MEALRALLTKLGYDDAATYIQSGNVVFRTDEPAAESERRIAAAFPKAFGFSAAIMVRSLGDWRKAAKANPFDASTLDPRKLVLHCLGGTPGAAGLKSLGAITAPEEKWQQKGTWLYAYFANGIARSKLASSIERALGVSVTARNWNTVLKLREMGEALKSA
jgi:uncharacterized protein (DUF1697 family)